MKTQNSGLPTDSGSAGAWDAERQLRIDLAALYHIVASFGRDDLLATHISVRLPGPDHRFLINPLGLLFEEITAIPAQSVQDVVTRQTADFGDVADRLLWPALLRRLDRKGTSYRD